MLYHAAFARGKNYCRFRLSLYVRWLRLWYRIIPCFFVHVYICDLSQQSYNEDTCILV